jgi:DNA-binding transcriptional MerR regulator
MTTVRYLPMPPVRLSLESLAASCGLHPALVHRFVALGLLEPEIDASGEEWFRPSDVHVIARIERLRVGLSLNYASIGLVMDLLDEIDRLHAAAAHDASTRPHVRRSAHTPRS